MVVVVIPFTAANLGPCAAHIGVLWVFLPPHALIPCADHSALGGHEGHMQDCRGHPCVGRGHPRRGLAVHQFRTVVWLSCNMFSIICFRTFGDSGRIEEHVWLKFRVADPTISEATQGIKKTSAADGIQKINQKYIGIARP